MKQRYPCAYKWFCVMEIRKKRINNRWNWASLVMSLVILVCLPMGCASSQGRLERLTKTQAAVAESLANRHLRIRVNAMNPARYASRVVSYGFYLELKGDTLESYLPYMGRVYQSAAFSTSEGLNFEAPVLGYQETRPKKDMSRIELQVKTRDDVYDYILDVYDTGQALIRVRAQNRDGISFDGDCDL